MPRPRGYIDDYNPRAKTRDLLDQVQHVFDTYRDELPLTGRQVFYRLVGTVDYPKDENAYGRLMEHLGNFRRAGIVSFEYIRDDGVTVLPPLEFASPEEILERAEQLAAEGQGVRLEGQPRWVELWCEAGGMAPQLARVVHPYGVTVYSCGGFDSLTAKYGAAQRIAGWGVPTVVLHVGDFDPSGLTMFQAALEDVAAFADAEGAEVVFKRVAVTPDQVARHNLPGAPPKKSSHDSIWRSGEDAVQAEALPPDVLAAEVQQAVETELDMDALKAAKSSEVGNRELFEDMMRRLRNGDGS